MSSIEYPIMNAEVLQAAFGFGEEGGATDWRVSQTLTEDFFQRREQIVSATCECRSDQRLDDEQARKNPSG